MMIHEITPEVGRYKARKRVGRGRASGMGKTSGRGHKGAGSRAGYSQKAAFEGGQMPYFRRMPKRGFSNVNFQTSFWTANLGDIAAHPDFASGGDVTPQALVDAGLIRDLKRPLKVLGGLKKNETSLSVKLNVTAHRLSQSARKLIEDAGGSVNELGVKARGNVAKGKAGAGKNSKVAKTQAGKSD